CRRGSSSISVCAGTGRSQIPGAAGGWSGTWRGGCRRSGATAVRSRAGPSRAGARFRTARRRTSRRCRQVALLAAERRLITISHSYVVAENRRLAHEMALWSRGRWQVTAIAPRSYAGDLRRIDLEPIPGEAAQVVPLDMALDGRAHVMWYRGLRRAMRQGADVVHAWEEPYVLAGLQIARAAPPDAKVVFATFQNLRKTY